MDNIIIAFISILIFFVVISLLGLWISTYPPVFLVKMFYRYPRHDINQLYFYYNKAVSYRMLFTTFSIFDSVLQVIAVAATLITIYIAHKDSSYDLLFSLISATCQMTHLILQPSKYIKVFSDAAIIMELALLETKLTEDLDDTLLIAYKKAESTISEIK